MPVYGDADTLYVCLRTLFDRIQAESPAALNGVQSSKLILRLKCTTPAAEVTANGRQRDVKFIYGSNGLRPDLEVEVAADTLHRILMDELTTQRAMGSGLIKLRGQIWKVPVLVDLFQTGKSYYPDVVREHGVI